MFKKILIGFILLLVLFSFGCVENKNLEFKTPPYDTPQFIYESTDLNYNLFIDGNYNDQVLYIDNNKISSYVNSYAGMWGKNNAGFTTTTISVVDTYYRVTGFTKESVLNGFTFNDSNLIAQYSGVYNILFTASVSDGASGEHGFKLFVNDSNKDNCYSYLNSTTNAQATSFSCKIRLVSGDKVNVRVDDHQTPPNNMTFYSANVGLNRIGN